jgi:hypothetical protein
MHFMKVELDHLVHNVQYSSLIHRSQNRLGEGGEGYHLSDVLCWLTVIWSGAPPDSFLGEMPTKSIFAYYVHTGILSAAPSACREYLHKPQRSGPGRDGQKSRSRSGIQTIFALKILYDEFFNADLDPGSGIISIRDGKNSEPGSGMEKIRIRDPEWKNSDPGSGMEKIRIRDKHPGSATLVPVYYLLPSARREYLHKLQRWRPGRGEQPGLAISLQPHLGRDGHHSPTRREQRLLHHNKHRHHAESGAGRVRRAGGGGALPYRHGLPGGPGRQQPGQRG